jgi:hypothetical protein
MNVKDIFNTIVELSKVEESELVKHNKSLAKKLTERTINSEEKDS